MTNRIFDLAVIGGGIHGSSAALFTARAGMLFSPATNALKSLPGRNFGTVVAVFLIASPVEGRR